MKPYTMLHAALWVIALGLIAGGTACFGLRFLLMFLWSMGIVFAFAGMTLIARGTFNK